MKADRLLKTGVLALASTAIVTGAALAQQQSGGNQTLTQESAAGQGVPLFVSPADVRQIQQALNEGGYEAGNVDGRFGDSTISAVCNFQQAQGLEPTGALNPQTISALGVQVLGGGQQAGSGGDQQLAQEAALDQGSPLFVSPATVRQIEQALNNAGYDAGNIDGVWDDALGSSLANFQQAQGLEPTGTIDIRTISALNVSFGGQGGQGDQTLAQESSVASPEDCVSAGQMAMQGAVTEPGGGSQMAASGGQQPAGQQQPTGQQQAAAGDQQQTGQQDVEETASVTPDSGANGGTQAQQQPQGGQQAASTGGGQAQGGAQLFLSTATVRQIEQSLNSAGYDAGTVDGLWDENLQAALANYQQAQGLEPTGNLNTRVVAALGGGQMLQSVFSGGGGQMQGGGQSGGQSGGAAPLEPQTPQQ